MSNKYLLKVAEVINSSQSQNAAVPGSERTKELLNTGIIASAGGVTNTIADRILHPKVKGGGGKAFALGTGLGILGDYTAVKINNKLNNHLDKVAEIKIKAKNKGLLHKKLGIPQGQHISRARLDSAMSRAKATGNIKLEREVGFAENARKWNHS